MKLSPNFDEIKSRAIYLLKYDNVNGHTFEELMKMRNYERRNTIGVAVIRTAAKEKAT
jgi:hypothetical protein